jgi:hypothetical protein
MPTDPCVAFFAEARRSYHRTRKAVAVAAEQGCPPPPAGHWRSRAEILLGSDPMTRADAIAACAALALAFAEEGA